MAFKTWTPAEVRAIARQTVDGRKAIATARGAYFRALIETAQAELGGKADQEGQLVAVKAVHKRFYPVVQEAIATDEIILAADVPRKKVALERNRRLNFARSAYGTIRRWLRAPGHDLMKIDASKATKSQLLQEAPPTRKQALTPERVQLRANKLIGGLVAFTKQVAKADQEQASRVLREALDRLFEQMVTAGVQATTDASVAAREYRPLRVGRAVFMPAEMPPRKAA